jgi:CheY-like chemotaxis protein/GGDEF domain-containing protein
VRPKILVVDDEPANLELLVRSLRKRYEVVPARSGAEALELLRGGEFAAILSDQRMPHMTGTEFLSRARELVPDTVRMILTGYAPEKESLDAINQARVATFLTKPIAPDAVERAVADAVELHEVSRKNRELAHELEEKSRALADAQRRLEHGPRREAETGLYGRAYFEERLAVELDRVERYGGVVSLVLCDVAGGDVIGLARRFAVEPAVPLRLRAPDLLAHWGGATLALLLPATSRSGAVGVSARLRAALVEYSLTCGVAEAPADATTPAELVAVAERQLLAAR